MKFKKILSLLTAAAMTLSLGITSVSADTTEEAGSVVAKIGETEYTSLADAFNAAANKATITVVADTSIIGENVILSGKNGNSRQFKYRKYSGKQQGNPHA